MAMKKSRGSIFAFCVLFLALQICGLASGVENLPPENKVVEAGNKENCNYTVTIETTCTQGAETSNRVSLRFGDTNGNDVLVHHLNSKHVRKVDPLEPMVLDDVPRKPFQACTMDEFQVTGQCVEKQICYMYLKLMGNDDWRPGLAQIRMTGASHLSSNYFYFRRYLPQHVWHGSDICDSEVTPFGIKYTRKVFPRKPIMNPMP
ncbi:hypothetical protein HHK36_016512 [Tetracentron sinense]|uniref:Uncharacterized protein n=1 Tax=Tetracentron sinense TaxID=13715 RepID=A0A835DEA6_TETSI|nr:hypothetical protein HHK36_016512 [Tetracentron sinense]